MTDREVSTTLPNGLPAPPVPQGLREMLRDYPEHIERLQEALNAVVVHPASGVDPYDRAIWALEGRIEAFIAEARKSLRAAEAQSDEALIARAKEHLHLMHGCGSRSLWKASNLLAYFNKRQEPAGMADERGALSEDGSNGMIR